MFNEINSCNDVTASARHAVIPFDISINQPFIELQRKFTNLHKTPSLMKATTSYNTSARRKELIGSFTNLLALCFFACCSHAAEQRYVKIQTEFEHIDHFGRDANKNRIEKHWKFSATTVVGRNEWRIDNNFAKNADITWFYDGTDMYYAFHLTGPASTNLKEQHPYILPSEASNVPDEVSAKASPDGLPLGNAGVNLPWLAFCSGNYLRHDGRIIPLPIGFPTPDAFGYSDKTRTFDDEFGLPRTSIRLKRSTKRR